MIWLLLFVGLILILIFSSDNSKKTTHPVQRKTLDINVANYPNKFEFLVSGGNFDEYLYGILNFTNQYDLVKLTPEPYNHFDKNAIKVECNNYHIGYIPSIDADEVHLLLKREHIAYVNAISKDGYISIKIAIGYK